MFIAKVIYIMWVDIGQFGRRGHKGMTRRSVIDQILREIRALKIRIKELEKTADHQKLVPKNLPESKLVALPDHLRTTYITLASIGECEASRISNLTGRCRSVESNYLNQLCRMGWVSKQRKSRSTLFSAISWENGHTNSEENKSSTELSECLRLSFSNDH